jgi:NADH:ubiquinone oxidoreductase subunit 6 (subunit J)
MLDSAIFWAFAIVSVAAALGAVLSRSAINAALCLIAAFMSIAGFYLLNNADFLAIAQIIIYAVGLTILMLFAIMFTGDKPFLKKNVNKASRVAYGVVLVYVFALLLRGIVNGFQSFPAVVPGSGFIARMSTEGSTALLGQLLFTDYSLPFEVASILLLAAMIGAIVIAKKRFVESESTLLGEMRLPVDLSSAPPEKTIEELRAKRLGVNLPAVKTDETPKSETPTR